MNFATQSLMKKGVLNRYQLQARVFPASLALLPVIAVPIAWDKDFLNATKPLIGIVCGSGFVLLLAQVGRDRGQRVQDKLVDAWGGLLTTVFLRHRNERIDAVSKARYHSLLAKHIPGITFPTPEQESADPKAADAIYASSGEFLKNHTRDQKKFEVLFIENIDYGFRRNLFGLKPVGILACIIGTVGCGWKLWLDHVGSTPGVSPVALLGTLLGVVLGLAWIFLINQRWVERAAESYALQLLRSIDQIGGKPKAKSPEVKTARKSTKANKD